MDLTYVDNYDNANNPIREILSTALTCVEAATARLRSLRCIAQIRFTWPALQSVIRGDSYRLREERRAGLIRPETLKPETAA